MKKEFSFRAIFFGVTIGLVLMALVMYMEAVLGTDTDVAPIASMLGVMLIPLFGGPSNRKEINIMQTCATAATFSVYTVTGNVVPLLMLGQKPEILPILILLLLADAIGICLVSILRDQYVYDPELPFPGAVMCITAMDQIDTEDKTSTKLLLGAVAFSVIVSFLQNMEYIPSIVDLTKILPVEGMSLSIFVLPMMLGMGYVLGSKNAICMMVVSLIVCLLEGPVGVKFQWFKNPAEDYAGIQDFNLPLVIGLALFAVFVPMARQWKSIIKAFQFKKDPCPENGDRDYSLKSIGLLLIVLVVALVGFSCIYYKIKLLHLIICTVISLVFGIIAIRVMAESGLSAGMALNMCMLFIAYALTKNVIFSMLTAFMNMNIFLLAQDTIYDLKIGQMIKASPKKQIKAQMIGIGFGCVFGTILFFGIIKTFGLNDDLFTYPIAHMYYGVLNGISEAGVSSYLDPGRFAIGGVLGAALSFTTLPAGGIALAMYLMPRTIVGMAIGGVIRAIIEKIKGNNFAAKIDNVATGLVIGDAVVCIMMVIITMVGI